MDDFTLTDNPARCRFEINKDGRMAAFAEYKVLQDALLFTHTEVLPAYEGQGLGSRLAGFALGEVRKRGLQAIPACTFMSGYIRKHHEYLDLVTPDNQRAYQL